MQCSNLPIQVIVHCAADGQLQPIRFRFQDNSRQTCTLPVEQIVDVRQVEQAGAEAILYLCRAKEHLYELKYTIRTHKWVLFRRIY